MKKRGRPTNSQREDKKRAGTYLDMLMALRVKTGLSEQTVRKVYLALVEYILEEIKMNNIARLRFLGNFYSKYSGGYVREMPNVKTGEMVERYVKPSMKVKFVVAESFVNSVSEPLGKQQTTDKESSLIDANSELKEQKNVLVKNLLKDEAYKLSKIDTNSSEYLMGLELEEELERVEEDMDVSLREEDFIDD